MLLASLTKQLIVPCCSLNCLYPVALPPLWRLAAQWWLFPGSPGTVHLHTLPANTSLQLPPSIPHHLLNRFGQIYKLAFS